MSVAVHREAGPRLASDAKLRRAALAALEYGGLPELELGIVIVSEQRIGELHARFLGDPSPTDVISFDLGEGEGELYVCAAVARAVAARRGLDAERELCLYVVHGALHLCGFDDLEPRARRRMRAAERAVLARLAAAPARAKSARASARVGSASARRAPSRRGD